MLYVSIIKILLPFVVKFYDLAQYCTLQRVENHLSWWPLLIILSEPRIRRFQIIEGTLPHSIRSNAVSFFFCCVYHMIYLLMGFWNTNIVKYFWSRVVFFSVKHILNLNFLFSFGRVQRIHFLSTIDKMNTQYCLRFFS